MALAKCPDCGREVSDEARACPQCGRPRRRSRVGLLLLVLAVSAAGLLALIAAAGRQRAEPPASRAPAPPPPTATPEAPEPIRLTTQFAAFRGDALDECLDIEATLASESDIPSAVEYLTKFRGKHADLKVPCAEQFPDRTPLARCILNKPSEKMAGAQLRIAATYYSVETVVDSDRYMKDCLSDNGEWWAAPRDDTAAAGERIRQRARKAMKLGESLAGP